MIKLPDCAIVISVLVLLTPHLIFAEGERVLVFQDASPYDGHIAPVKAADAMLREFGAANKFSIDTTVNLSSFNSANLAKYDAVVMLHPYRVGLLNDTMNASEDSAFQSFMNSGKGLVGIHCADRLNNNSPWYLNLLGVQYQNDIGPQNCTYHVADTTMTKGIPQTFVNSQQVRCNKLFFSDTSKEYKVLIKADQKDYPADQKQSFYPYVWIHNYQGARVWCGSMGHTPQTFSSDTIWRKLMLRGILYALNRPGYTPTTALEERMPGLVPGEAGLVAWRDGDMDGLVDVFDFAGRKVCRLSGGPIREGVPHDGALKLPFGTYIAVPVGAKLKHAVLHNTPGLADYGLR